jgi:hypothetical protein
MVCLRMGIKLSVHPLIMNPGMSSTATDLGGLRRFLALIISNSETDAIGKNSEDGERVGKVTAAATTIMKNGVFWDVMACGSCKNRRFGGTWRLLHQGDKNRQTRDNASCNQQLTHDAKKYQLNCLVFLRSMCRLHMHTLYPDEYLEWPCDSRISLPVQYQML